MTIVHNLVFYGHIGNLRVHLGPKTGANNIGPKADRQQNGAQVPSFTTWLSWGSLKHSSRQQPIFYTMLLYSTHMPLWTTHTRGSTKVVDPILFSAALFATLLLACQDLAHEAKKIGQNSKAVQSVKQIFKVSKKSMVSSQYTVWKCLDGKKLSGFFFWGFFVELNLVWGL